MPASRVVRLASSSSTCSPMRLNSRARVASSVGPVSASGSGRRPWPMRCVALASRASGRMSQLASPAEVLSVTKMPTARISSIASQGCTSTRLAGKPTRTVPRSVGRSAQYHSSPSSAWLARSTMFPPVRELSAVSSSWKYGSMRGKPLTSPGGSCTWMRYSRPMRSCSQGRSPAGSPCQFSAVSIISAARSLVALRPSGTRAKVVMMAMVKIWKAKDTSAMTSVVRPNRVRGSIMVCVRRQARRGSPRPRRCASTPGAPDRARSCGASA